MNLFSATILVLLVCTCSGERLSRSVIECVRKIVKEGKREARIPKCQVLNFNIVDIDTNRTPLKVTNGTIRVNVEIEDPTSFGENSFVEKDQHKPDTVRYRGILYYSKLKVTLINKFDIKRYDNELKHTPFFHFTFKNVGIHFIVALTTDPPILKNFKLDIDPVNWTNLKMEVAGIQFIQLAFLQQLLRSRIPNMINTMLRPVFEYMEPSIVEYINSGFFEARTYYMMESCPDL